MHCMHADLTDTFERNDIWKGFVLTSLYGGCVAMPLRCSPVRSLSSEAHDSSTRALFLHAITTRNGVAWCDRQLYACRERWTHPLSVSQSVRKVRESSSCKSPTSNLSVMQLYLTLLRFHLAPISRGLAQRSISITTFKLQVLSHCMTRLITCCPCAYWHPWAVS
jgi:hypothetical protein